MRVTGDGGVGLEVFVDGPDDGTPVLFMHGWPDDHTLWRHQVDALSAAGYRTIAPDLRGFGASDKPADVASYALKHTVVDMLAVLEACGGDKGARRCARLGCGERPGDRVVPARPGRVADRVVGRASGCVPRRGLAAAELVLVHAAVPVPASPSSGSAENRNLREWSRATRRRRGRGAARRAGALTASLGLVPREPPPAVARRRPPALPPVSAPAWASGAAATWR